MLDTANIMILTRWCRARRLNWMPAIADDGAQAIRLAPIVGSLPSQNMLVIAGDEGFCLLGSPGGKLAVASDLPSLLDALDAGVAAPVTRAGRHVESVRRVYCSAP
jgi:hypothetical protein